MLSSVHDEIAVFKQKIRGEIRGFEDLVRNVAITETLPRGPS